MSYLNSGLLSTYNSLTDKHLAGYFNNTRIRRHLQRVGLITRSGKIVPDKEYRLKLVRRDHQRHVRECLAQAIFHKVLDMERHHQIEIKRKLEDFARRERVHKIKVERSKRYDEDVIPLISPKPPSGPRNGRRQPSGPEGEHSESSESPGSSRPNTAPGKMQRPHRLQPINRNTASVRRTSPGSRLRDSSDDTEQQFTLTEKDLRPVTVTEFSHGLSPYQLPIINNYITPVPPSTKRTLKGTQNGTMRGRRLRPTTAPSATAIEQQDSKLYKTSVHSNVSVTMVYYGKTVHLSHDDIDMRDEVKVFQQHCGGENVCVYKGRLMEGEAFLFVSRRHRGFPFSLTFFLNGLQVDRLSSCCEFKHRKGSRLGGKHGHFGFSSVGGASPCYKCIISMGLDKKPTPPKRTKEEMGKGCFLGNSQEMAEEAKVVDEEEIKQDSQSRLQSELRKEQVEDDSMETEAKDIDQDKAKDDYDEDFEADDERADEDMEEGKASAVAPDSSSEKRDSPINDKEDGEIFNHQMEDEEKYSDSELEDDDKAEDMKSPSCSFSPSSRSREDSYSEADEENEAVKNEKVRSETEMGPLEEQPQVEGAERAFAPAAEKDQEGPEEHAEELDNRKDETSSPAPPQTKTTNGDPEAHEGHGDGPDTAGMEPLNDSMHLREGKEVGKSGAAVDSGDNAAGPDECLGDTEPERAKSVQEKLVEAIMKEAHSGSEPELSDTSTEEEDLPPEIKTMEQKITGEQEEEAGVSPLQKPGTKEEKLEDTENRNEQRDTEIKDDMNKMRKSESREAQALESVDCAQMQEVRNAEEHTTETKTPEAEETGSEVEEIRGTDSSNVAKEVDETMADIKKYEEATDDPENEIKEEMEDSEAQAEETEAQAEGTEAKAEETEAQVKETGAEETKAQEAETVAEETEAQEKETVAEETKAQEKETVAEEAEAQEKETEAEDTEAQEKETGAEDTEAQEKETVAEEAEAQEKETGAEEAEAQEKETGAEEAEAQEKETGAEDTEAQEEETGAEEAEAQEKETVAEEAEAQEKESGAEEAEAQEKETEAEDTEAQEKETGAEEIEAQEKETGTEKTEAQEKETGAEETEAQAEGTELLEEVTDSKTEGTETHTEGTEALEKETGAEETERQTEMTEAQAEVTQSQAEVTQTQVEVTETQTEVTETQAEGTEVTETQAEGTEAQAEVRETQAEGTEAQAEVTETQAEVTQTQAEGTEAQAEMTETQAEVTQTQAEVTETHAEATETQAEGTEAHTEVTETQAEVTQTQAEGTEAQAEVTETQAEETETEVTETQAEVTQTQAEVTETQAEGTEAQSEVTETQAEVIETQAEVTETQAEVAETQIEVTETQAEVTETQAEMTETQAEVAEVTETQTEVTEAEECEAHAEVTEEQSEDMDARVNNTGEGENSTTKTPDTTTKDDPDGQDKRQDKLETQEDRWSEKVEDELIEKNDKTPGKNAAVAKVVTENTVKAKEAEEENGQGEKGEDQGDMAEADRKEFTHDKTGGNEDNSVANNKVQKDDIERKQEETEKTEVTDKNCEMEATSKDTELKEKNETEHENKDEANREDKEINVNEEEVEECLQTGKKSAVGEDKVEAASEEVMENLNKGDREPKSFETGSKVDVNEATAEDVDSKAEETVSVFEEVQSFTEEKGSESNSPQLDIKAFTGIKTMTAAEELGDKIGNSVTEEGDGEKGDDDHQDKVSEQTLPGERKLEERANEQQDASKQEESDVSVNEEKDTEITIQKLEDSVEEVKGDDRVTDKFENDTKEPGVPGMLALENTEIGSNIMAKEFTGVQKSIASNSDCNTDTNSVKSNVTERKKVESVAEMERSKDDGKEKEDSDGRFDGTEERTATSDAAGDKVVDISADRGDTNVGDDLQENEDEANEINQEIAAGEVAFGEVAKVDAALESKELQPEEKVMDLEHVPHMETGASEEEMTNVAEEDEVLGPETMMKEDEGDLVASWVNKHQASRCFQTFIEPLDDLKDFSSDEVRESETAHTKELSKSECTEKSSDTTEKQN
ncbi:glutamate-rich protein 3 isoform X6 [Anguilla anguilla]|uniref:glutamate-rich protein 3 isoform X6 n=1 Tax=Anguilla anguilla TaxID=7936 RepID=UPI0015B0141B|nr:glutamate-rich protein 3 isoform X6 [Anguilla anguilla]